MSTMGLVFRVLFRFVADVFLLVATMNFVKELSAMVLHVGEKAQFGLGMVSMLAVMFYLQWRSRSVS